MSLFPAFVVILVSFLLFGALTLSAWRVLERLETAVRALDARVDRSALAHEQLASSVHEAHAQLFDELADRVAVLQQVRHRVCVRALWLNQHRCAPAAQRHAGAD